MFCPHCQGRLPAHRPVTDPGRYKLYGHHGETEVDAGQVKALIANAEAFLSHRRKITEALNTLQVYQEVVNRLERDPAFARHVFGYDGDGGRRFFPGASRKAERAEIAARIRAGKARDGDLPRYMELSMEK